MRCDCCDVSLSTVELRTRWRDNNDFTNTCFDCLKSIDRLWKMPRDDNEELIVDDPAYEQEDVLDMHEDDYWAERE